MKKRPVQKMMNEALLDRARKQQFPPHNPFWIVSHLRPDGDAIGSTLGLGLSLQAAGKQVQLVLQDGVPLNFNHLHGFETIKRKPDGAVDCIIVVDCSDLTRAGEVLEEYGTPDINIDHHATNTNFAKINLVDTQAVAVAEMLTEYIPQWGYPLPVSAGAALLTGLITDTIGFRTQNVTSKSLRMAADLIDLGVDMPTLYEKALVLRSFESLQFWGAGLSQIQRNDRMVWTTLTMKDRRSAGYHGRDDADLINILSAVKDCDIAMIFVEQPEDRVKVSWRARPGFDISKVALSFGGGGHPAASGAELYGSIEEVQVSVLDATHILLHKQESLVQQQS
ncbi:MAG: bifunctional oligoribonuclease/PAP phosphatase NrnA [Anaerolineae bacterium]|nr:bifunctional oligoribonuclease/PAP phosphatase NrnA [Anaerolineae bacterium]